ncbi:AER092Wp [Eremothecium gossypii ATCC 10895]|uniref:Vacuolar protein-sorting-associated protein 36 n=1 Tax=Eremothecium gossypii (strain ATCC 10895 / CBS 109.51 / FGSC 9923 / NRRL Y-1056) TaxID=284811 RepID=Q757C1_EREGS|nr:AER092Wp [Eremothecium gossypii ATCC 10895]AAS52776.1 AER092Wp [Eremothecium gossypii ATCC 10895]AEY97082.1 FAER092Wp [Eremothecium gossypii FDAG1]
MGSTVNYLSYWQYAETTASGHPVLREGERDIYVEQDVGLYHGKIKILNKQKGRCYLTSQRIIYVDDTFHAKESVSIELDDVEKARYNAKFLKRATKTVLFLKPNSKHSLGGKASRSNVDQKTFKRIVEKSQWTCAICMAHNEVNMEIQGYMPPCVNCGISVDFEMISKSLTIVYADDATDAAKNKCPACTFDNHVHMNNCEMCGTRLPNMCPTALTRNQQLGGDPRVHIELEGNPGFTSRDIPFVQLSFRRSDGSLFFEALCKQLEDWESDQKKHMFNQDLTKVNGVGLETPIFEQDTRFSTLGIASLEKSREEQLLKNDILLNKALTDLGNLAALASDIEKLYHDGESAPSNTNPTLVIDRDKFLSKSAFIDEIAREIYQLTVSEFKDQREKHGTILVPLVDLYALYNKSMRIGTGYVSPEEMREACERFGKLGLTDLSLSRINGRVLCIASANSFEAVKRKIMSTIEHSPGADLLQITKQLNRENDNAWAIGIIMEVLQNCVKEGNLLIDEQISGIHYYINVCWRI